MNNSTGLSSSRALWNRKHLDLRSKEIIAQILDFGERDDWRELYKLCKADAKLRHRTLSVIMQVPLAYGHFWLSALAAIDQNININAELPAYSCYADGT
ncbi:MAG: hypothetical protein JW841_11260 [Deltaproteobacteria bacterium]|nr:hypothetical protein [Deltaproteobacteria bacterium]